MKKISFLLSLLAAFGLYSCTKNEVILEGIPSVGLTAEIPAYQFEGETRVSISQNLNAFTWDNEDKIGMYYQDDMSKVSAKFTVLSGGSSSGVFTNSAFSLKPNTTYYAFYPYNGQAMVNSYPVDFTGQIQTENGDTKHIGKRNYMSARVTTDAQGAAKIAFENLAAVVQVVLPISKAGTYTSVTLSSDTDDFIVRGTMDMRTGTITPTEKSGEMKLTFEEGIALNEGELLTANFLVAPTDLSGKQLTVTLETVDHTVSFTGLGKKIEKGKAYRLSDGDLELDEIPYLTFSSKEVQTLSMTKAVETLEYSVNDGDWLELGTSTVTFGGENGDLRLRGKSSMGTAASPNDYSKIRLIYRYEVDCSGDIRTLVDYTNYKKADTSNARFCNLFYECTLTSAPELPATNLADYCYSRMFMSCFFLPTAPELPAKILADHCYSEMFSSCDNLTSAPELPADSLASSCYASMFSHCLSLVTAPELPATILATACYSDMFYSCGNLINAPQLPATTLKSSCYSSMFAYCTSLINAPVLSAETLDDACYSSMFSGCTSLVTAPALPITTLAEGCYSFMFSGCTSLVTAPELPATTLVEGCYFEMFSGCTSLNYIKMMATDIISDWLYDWTAGVAASGTFVKNAAATWDVSGTNGIPEGWTVETATK